MSKNGEAVKMRKKIDIIIIFVGLLFLAIGILASCLCIHTVKSTYDFFIKTGKTEACIVDITFTRSTSNRRKWRNEMVKNVYVSYEIHGVVYDHVRLNSEMKNEEEGDLVTIYYNPDNPYEIKAIDSIFFPVIPFIFAVGFLFSGCMIFKKEVFHLGENRKPKAAKICVELPIAEVGVDSSVKRNGHPAFYVICEKGSMSLYPPEIYCDDCYLKLPEYYKSDNWFYPEFDLCTKAGDIVPVYINPKNPKEYFIDVKKKKTA